jgi:hypothetical protein
VTPIEETARLRSRAEHALRLAVAAERAGGSSWQDIGEALGCTRQAAHERYAVAVDEINESPGSADADCGDRAAVGRRGQGAGLDVAVAIARMTELAHQLVDGPLPPGVSGWTAQRMLLEAKVRAYDLMAATQNGARARAAQRESAAAFEDLVRWHRADARDRLGHVAYCDTEALITYDGRPVQLLQRHNDPADDEGSGWLLCSIGDQSACGRLTARQLPAPLRATILDVTGLYGDGEIIAGVDAPQTMALAAALDRVCDHIAVEAASGRPPFAPGGIAGPPAA